MWLHVGTFIKTVSPKEFNLFFHGEHTHQEKNLYNHLNKNYDYDRVSLKLIFDQVHKLRFQTIKVS